MKCLFFFLLIVLAFPEQGRAASVGSVNVTASNAGTQIVSSICSTTIYSDPKYCGGVTVTVPSNAAVAVWFAKIEGTCSAVLTTQAGYRITPGNGFDFLPSEDGYTGQICAILDSGAVAVSVKTNVRP